MKDIKTDLERLKNLSTVPVVMKRILETVGDERKGHYDLGRIIEHDQSLAEKVVAMANSPYFGHAGLINNIEQAILLLGFDLVKSLAISMSVFKIFSKTEIEGVKKFWAHSYRVAIASSLLCDKIPVTTPGVCFLAGLLHDIGRVVFLSLYPDIYKPIMFESDLLEKEKTLFGIGHPEVSRMFLENTLIPDEIIISVRFHHNINECTKHKGVATTVYLSEGIVSRFENNNIADGLWDNDMEDALYASGLSYEDIGFIEDVLNEEGDSIMKFFEL
jgi:HD-like signal output (HDOD) protein